MTTPADELRTAAARLSALAAAATPGSWWAEELPANDHHKHPAHWVKTEYEDGENCLTSQVVADCPWAQADADFIELMNPGVGAAFADWLDAEAAHRRAVDVGQPMPGHEHALAVARQINTGGTR
ncbi:ead/Ea22-like family protein [Streptomyces sp. NPDC058155]|uniref:ead/Ea22-like family protein n=1 Tax=Streptomyces sp. NPDC058155 TaxID=3346359 RepID=UPI0036E0B92B